MTGSLRGLYFQSVCVFKSECDNRQRAIGFVCVYKPVATQAQGAVGRPGPLGPPTPGRVLALEVLQAPHICRVSAQTLACVILNLFLNGPCRWEG